MKINLNKKIVKRLNSARLLYQCDKNRRLNLSQTIQILLDKTDNSVELRR